MKLIFYKVSDPKNKLDKTLDNLTKLELEGYLRDRADILYPIIIVTTDVTEYNYCYCPELHRYFFVDSCEIYRRSAWICKLSVDVLMSYSTEIKLMQGVVSRLADGSEYAQRTVVQDVRKRVSKINWNYTFSMGSKVLVTEGSN